MTSQLFPPNRGPALLEPWAERYVAAGYRRLLRPSAGLERGLRAVIEDALDHPGSLVRAQLAFDVQRRHGVAPRRARQLAVAIEYFHTASLLFDDLPAMDGATTRRGRPCPHTVWGEASVMLAALALINRAYALLWQVLAELPAERRRRAGRLVEQCLGMAGILDGQARDLGFVAGSGEEAVRAVAHGKTVTLVRLSLLLPAIVAGVEAAEIARLDRLASAWGLAYQVLDDWKDLLLSGAEAGKSTGRDRVLGRPSMPREAGAERSLAILDRQLAMAREELDALTAEGAWSALARLQTMLEGERRKVTDGLADTPLRTRACAGG